MPSSTNPPFTIRPKLIRLIIEQAERYDGTRTLSGFSTAYVLSRTLEQVLHLLSKALAHGRTTGIEQRTAAMVEMRDACIETAAVLLACAEQAERDRQSLIDKEKTKTK